jgi:type IV pilus assembly protein PilX
MNTAMHPPRARQRGVVLIFALIVLLILTIGAVALMRSMHSSLFAAGNLAFRRDLTNQGEQAVANVMAEFRTGGILATSGITDSDLISANYKATTLVTNPQGVPTALLVGDTAFAAYGQVSNDITGATPDVTIRYMIDRLCIAPAGIASSALCVQSSGTPTGGTHNRNTAVAPPSATVYRLSVRVSQTSRNTQVFLQTTFTKPD